MSMDTDYNGSLKMEIDQDDWGCVEPSQLFTSTGKTQSLRFLVDQLAKNNDQDNGTGPQQLGTSQHLKCTSSNGVKYGEQSSCGQAGINGASPPATFSSNGAARRKTVPKTILKQKRGFRTDKAPSLKRVTFEVERYVIDNLQVGSEKETAEAQMAIRLGAKLPKSKPINYKQLKVMRHQQKADNESESAELLRSLNSQSKKLQKRKKFNVANKNMTKKQSRKTKKASVK
ncbi:transformer-2a3 [Ditylenchus destructor]|nr:transformer-2a3 [Ditylenchus destructor]